jgi:isocitrate dehydrogenase
MAAHNYDGDMLTDEIAQIHRSPGFITSNLIGKNEDGTLIKEFEASHGTVADMWHEHLIGKETSLNPLGLVEALIGAMNHSALLAADAGADAAPVTDFTALMRASMEKAFVSGLGTRDLVGPSGLTTEQFVDCVGALMEGEDVAALQAKYAPKAPPRAAAPSPRAAPKADQPVVDHDLIRGLFEQLDTNGDGSVTFEEFERGLTRLNVAPRKGEAAARELRISLDDPI